MNTSLSTVRIDKWLWAARFFKTRSLATEAVDGGRIKLNGIGVKPAKDVKVGDRIEIAMGAVCWEIVVTGLSEKRGSATVAHTLYQETEASERKRQEAAEARRFQVEPALELHGRPTKRDRRSIDRWRG